MQLFYAPDIDSDHYRFGREESRHLAKVLRLHSGDELHVTNGKGLMMKARLVDDNPKAAVIEIIEKQQVPAPRVNIQMAVAPTKNIDRYEWFLEKATEIGVSVITPILCAHSERKVIRTDRLEKVITSAMKQSLKAHHPELHDLVKFKDFLESVDAEKKYIAHLDLEQPTQLKEVYNKAQDVVILIGPEGDFSPEEVKLAEEFGFEKVALGMSRLRTETAALVACHTINLLFD